MIMILSQLIFWSHFFMMIYLTMKSKHPRLSRHFCLSWWLCQALAMLRLVSISIKKFYNHPRLLITHLYALKINLTQIMLPPLELHDPIAHALEESYIESTRVRHTLSLFLSFACMSQSRVCMCLKAARSVTQRCGKSTDHMLYTCTHSCSMDTLKHGVCLSSLLYLSCLVVHTTGLLMDQAFTNMGQPMCQWLHWKYHFTWSAPCTVSLGVGLVFAFMFVCLLSCFLTHFSFTFASAFLCCLFSCFVCRLVSHETMYDSWNKLGKVQGPCTAITTWLFIILPLYEELVTLVHDTSMENMYDSKWTLGKTQCLHTN